MSGWTCTSCVCLHDDHSPPGHLGLVQYFHYPEFAPMSNPDLVNGRMLQGSDRQDESQASGALCKGHNTPVRFRVCNEKLCMRVKVIQGLVRAPCSIGKHLNCLDHCALDNFESSSLLSEHTNISIRLSKGFLYSRRHAASTTPRPVSPNNSADRPSAVDPVRRQRH
jgi:hypothetical protein